MNIIFDFDGTLVNSKLRLYNLFVKLVPESKLSFEQYWELKHNKQSHFEILKENYSYSESKLKIFHQQWMSLIESEKYLEYDTLYPDVKKILVKLAESNNLYLCTARQYQRSVLFQLNKFGIEKYFSDVFVTEQKYSKEELLTNCGVEFETSDLLIGDTGYDVETGKKLKIRTCAVSYGFISRDNLINYSSDLLIDQLSDLTEEIKL